MGDSEFPKLETPIQDKSLAEDPELMSGDAEVRQQKSRHSTRLVAAALAALGTSFIRPQRALADNNGNYGGSWYNSGTWSSTSTSGGGSSGSSGSSFSTSSSSSPTTTSTPTTSCSDSSGSGSMSSPSSPSSPSPGSNNGEW